MDNEIRDFDPITIVKTHFVKPECHKAFESEFIKLSGIISKFPGYMGINIFRPLDPADGDYRVVIKFRSRQDRLNWTNSVEYKNWEILEKKMTIVPPRVYTVNGLETWFTLPGNRVMKPPKKERQYFVTWLAVWPLLSVLSPIEKVLFGELPYLLQNMVNVAILVFFLTYIVMPFMAKIFKRFLYPEGTRKILDSNDNLINEL